MDDTSKTNSFFGSATSPDQALMMNAEWLATVSHELQSPLMVIQGYVQLLLRHEDHLSDEERHEFLQEIDKKSTHMISLLDRLLMLARFEAGDIYAHLEPIDLVQLIQQTILKFSEGINRNVSTVHRSINLLPRPDEGKDQSDTILLMADKRLLQEMFMQLLDNAHKYSSITVPIEIGIDIKPAAQWKTLVPDQISTSIEATPQMMVEIRIRDYGIGIPARHHDAIFQRFYRVDMKLTRKVAGLGLGLTLCQHIVTLLGGIIWIESLPDTGNTGSTIHVLLPVQ
ncbi:sensor histidine kinase [Tengunoibacter tsumagoiensis]|uniref:histidine kinase n=1 Tax=Tengunoibacter tsumagoiensis TaxID=2014871 RepID=A0A401ZXN6_9CHLR|nr:HAMP domain-containing sensor histidine kinase [Tengunoibacter tsumagoiensis]GCE11614.1 hypothetical protein KTT_14730 [Tengunoibacter tsumagoiensis]